MRKLTRALAAPALIVLALSACSATEDGGGGDSGDDGSPVTVTEGKAFEFGNWKAQAGWKIGSSFLGYEVKGLTIENTKNEADQAFFEIKLLNGKDVVAVIDCTTDEIEAGQTIRPNCLPDGNKKQAYKTIEVENTF